MLLSIQKMTCGHCIRSVTSAVRAIDPNASVAVDLANGTAHVAGHIDAETAAQSIREQGYTVRVVEP